MIYLENRIFKYNRNIFFLLFLLVLMPSFASQTSFSASAGITMIKTEKNNIQTQVNVQKIQKTSSFISKWDTTQLGATNSTQVELPLIASGTYNFEVNWGDGMNNNITNSTAIHNYASPGIYTITISGTIDGWEFGNQGDYAKIIEISQWGPLKFGNTGFNFETAYNLVLTANDSPDLSGTTTLAGAFANCQKLGNVGNLNGWNLSQVTDTDQMFVGANNFNDPISNWDVSHVTNMYNMFYSDNAFNQPIGNWNVSQVTNMNAMFIADTAFNQPLNNWNVSHVTTMVDMFYGATAFNQPLNNWDVSHVTNMGNMFASVTLSYVNYDSILNAWSKLSLQSSVSFGAGNSQYTSIGSVARQFLISNFSWTITDGGLKTFLAPSAPQNLSAITGNGFVNLSWSPPSSFGGSFIIQYNIYKASTINSDLNYVLLTTTNNDTSFYIDHYVSNGITYYYKISALNYGGSNSPFTNETNVTPSITIPASPVLTVTPSNQSIYLSWTVPTDGGSPILKYQIYRGEESGQYSFIGVTTHSYFNDTNLQSGIKYYYVVTAVNSIGESKFSIEQSATPYASTTLQSSNSHSSKNSPGFEIFPAILFLSLFSAIVVVKKRRK